MKDKNKKKVKLPNKKKIGLPKLTPLNLIILIGGIILLFFIIAIPVVYVKEYNSTKVTPFESDIKDLSSKDIIRGNKNSIEDFNFVLWCKNYNNETGSISFRMIAYENEDTRSKINVANKISVKLGMYSNWIKTEKSTSSYSRMIAPGPKAALNSSRYYADYTLSGLPTLPKKGGVPFVKIKSIPLYAYVTYTTTINGTETTKRYILKYEYKDYIIESKVLDDNRNKEVQVSTSSSPYFQWKYEKDTSWTNICAVDDVTGIEIRADANADHIQWKRKCDNDWINLIPYSKLNGYELGKIPQVRISSNSIQWRWEDSEEYKSLPTSSEYPNSTVTLLKQPDYRVTDTHIQWKRKNQTEYINLKPLTELDNYAEGKKVLLRISGSNLEWRYDNESTYKVLTSINSLMGVEIKKDSSGDILFKCVDETEWKNLMLKGQKVTTSSLESSPAVIGPTAGGI